MNKIAMSPAASALIRALIGRSRASRDRILLTEVRSTDWRSLTFNGQRHQIQFRIPGPNACEIVDRMCGGIEDAEFSIPGHVVADIALLRAPKYAFNGTITLTVEALTIEAD